MTFGDSDVLGSLYAAERYREPVTLTADQVADLIGQWPGDEEFISYDELVRHLSKVDVKALRISVRAQREIAQAFGYEAEDIWA